MSVVRLDQQRQRIEVSDFEITNPIVFGYFDRLPATEREAILYRAIYIGVLALMEDRLAAFLSKTSSELGVQLESLKVIFDLKQELFFKSTQKGTGAEEEIGTLLESYFKDKGLKDTVKLTGVTSGVLPRNKTGDLVCNVDGREDRKIVIECKFDKSIRLGDISDKDVYTRKTDTAWSQLLEAQVNRDGKISIIVFDTSVVDATIQKFVESVRYLPSIGFLVIVDSQSRNYLNLLVAYGLARDIALSAKSLELDKSVLELIIKRIVRDLQTILAIRNLVEKGIEANREILRQLEKVVLLMEFNQKYLQKFLQDGTLTARDLLDFYDADDVRERYRPIEQEINLLGSK